MTAQSTDTSRSPFLARLGIGFMLLALGIIALNSFEYWRLHISALDEHKLAYQTGTVRAAMDMERTFRYVETTTDAMAQAITDGSLPKEQYESALAEMLRKEDIFYGAAIAYAPYAFDPERKLYAPYYSKKDGVLQFMYIEESYDYTQGDQEWYEQAMTSGSRWSKPYFDEAVGDILMVTYSSVVYRDQGVGEREAVAVVTIDLGIEAIGDTVKAFGLGGTGYAEIVTGEGLYLHSPTQSLVLNRETLFDHPRWVEDRGFEHLRELILNDETGVTRVVDLENGLVQWVSVAPIPATPWHIIGNFADADVEPRTPALRHRLMFIALGAVLLLCTAGLFWRVGPLTADAIISWPTSILLTLVLLLGTTQIWRTAMSYSSDVEREVFAVSSQQAVAREVRDYRQRALEHLTEPPIVIPTGVYIESMQSMGASGIRVVGVIWQKYDVETTRDLDRGIVFPGAARVHIGDPVVRRSGESELVRWQFSGEWRFAHHYARYPLLKDVFGIGIFPLDTAENILLVPDTESYPFLSPSSLPGMSPDVFLLGWNVEKSFFELRPWRHNATFGLDPSLKVEPMPELYFSTDLEKAFVHSVISNLTPLAIAMTIAFIALLISTRDKERLEVLGTGVSFDIGICTSIFFVVVLSHITLRQRIISEEIFYLEYFYLLMYANLIWVCCHSILAAYNHPILLKLTCGVSAKKAYFPVNFLLIFVFTWLIFYP